MTFSRRHDHQTISLQIQPIIKEIIKLSRSSLPSTIETNQMIPADCGAIMGDPIKIHQIIMNLVTNALISPLFYVQGLVRRSTPIRFLPWA